MKTIIDLKKHFGIKIMDLLLLAHMLFYFGADARVMRPGDTKKFFAEKHLSYKDTTIVSGGRPMRFVCTGNDTMPVMFFIHGSPGAWSDYKDYLSDTALQKRFYMISADRPGYNGSKGDAVATLEEQVNCLEGVFALRRNNKQMVVFGHSYGGAVSVKFSIEHRDRIQRLIMISPCLAPDVEQRIYWKRAAQNFTQTWVGKAVIPRIFRNSTTEMKPLPDEVRAMEKDYALLTMPILEIHGTWDWMAPYGNLSYIEKSFPNCNVETVTFKNKNHKIVYSMPEVMIGIILKVDASMASR